ncbi:hypothetical protein EDD37DRAFT_661514, partial [Exophiala viscosa]|uniref:uncharacterized protein n=1 Tax=Exophiala viscosa TaxID=2486360 RepID=UPI0021A20325
MDDDIFEIYISDLKFTEPARILRYSTKAETVVEHVEPVQVQELLTLLRSKDQQQPRIKTEDTLYGNLLVIEGVGAEELPIRMERAVFLDLLAHMQIPRIFVRSMTDHGGHYSTFINHEERDGQLRPESIYFIVATPVAKWRMFSCCLRIHLVNSEVSGIILHSNVGAIKRVPRLFQGRQKDLAMSPVSFLVFLLEMFGLETTLHSTYLAEDIRKAEEKTGFWEDMNSTIVASKYEQLNKDVYSCRLRLSSLRRFTDFQQEFGQF